MSKKLHFSAFDRQLWSDSGSEQISNGHLGRTSCSSDDVQQTFGRPYGIQRDPAKQGGHSNKPRRFGYTRRPGVQG